MPILLYASGKYVHAQTLHLRHSPSISVRQSNGLLLGYEPARSHQYEVHTICEEATGLPPKSCVESLADELGIGWQNIDLTIEERNLVPDKGDRDQIQDLHLFECREKTWVARTSDAVRESGLLICGMCHAFTIAEKLQGSFDLTVHVYDPSSHLQLGGPPNRSSEAQIDSPGPAMQAILAPLWKSSSLGRPSKRIPHPHAAIQPSIFEVLGDYFLQPIMFGVSPEVRIEPGNPIGRRP